MLNHIYNNDLHNIDDWVKSWGIYRWAGVSCTSV